MMILELLVNAATALIVGYLALTNSLAEYLTPDTEVAKHNSVIIETHTLPPTTIDRTTELTKIESTYKPSDTIPQILLENSAYQQAAVGSGVADTPIELFETERLLSEKITDALVNIYCQFSTEDYVRTTTGTGFLISENGVILTNAHVAQFLLFDDIEKVKSTECIIRGGSPAEPLYKADLLYIPPTWITTNASLISAERPEGTGERDYALLYVSEPLKEHTLPKVFNFIAPEVDLMERNTIGDTVHAAGYPAESLFKYGPDATLRSKIATTTVEDLYTFSSNYADIFSIRGSAVGEQGSSGGPIVRANGNVIGLIVTKDTNRSEAGHGLRGLTLSYIDRTIKEETGFSLQENMQGDLVYRAQLFKEALAPFLSRFLSFELE